MHTINWVILFSLPQYNKILVPIFIIMVVPIVNYSQLVSISRMILFIFPTSSHTYENDIVPDWEIVSIFLLELYYFHYDTTPKS